MAIRSNFPLCASDQSDVIRIYIELMSEAACAAESATTDKLRRSRKKPVDSKLSSEPVDLD